VLIHTLKSNGFHMQKGAQVVQKSPAVSKPQSKKVTKPVKESSSEESSEESSEDEPVKPVSKVMISMQCVTQLTCCVAIFNLIVWPICFHYM